ncbi:hypothetical protein HK405_015084 [Cladochytrium tenue]|nr:hypothetical protein HK405_015084 [Cladochytrium tenue]
MACICDPVRTDEATVVAFVEALQAVHGISLVARPQVSPAAEPELVSIDYSDPRDQTRAASPPSCDDASAAAACADEEVGAANAPAATIERAEDPPTIGVGGHSMTAATAASIAQLAFQQQQQQQVIAALMQQYHQVTQSLIAAASASATTSPSGGPGLAAAVNPFALLAPQLSPLSVNAPGNPTPARPSMVSVGTNTSFESEDHSPTLPAAAQPKRGHVADTSAVGEVVLAAILSAISGAANADKQQRHPAGDWTPSYAAGGAGAGAGCGVPEFAVAR